MLNSAGSNNSPLVSIGLPVFNGGRSLAPAIQSILSQTHQNFELIISDNCSTDETSAICKNFAAKDNRIKYFRQVKNIGAAANFRFVLEQAVGKYYFWAACDDTRSSDFIAVNVDYLESHPNYVASISRSRNEGGKFSTYWMGDRPLNHDSYEKKILTFFKGWHRAAIFYSIYRREAIVNHPILYGPTHLAQDWTMIMHTAKLGHMQRIEQGEVIFGTDGESKGIRHMRGMRKRRIEYFFPHWELCMFLKEISKDFSTRARITLLFRAIILNIRANLMRLIYVFET